VTAPYVRQAGRRGGLAARVAPVPAAARTGTSSLAATIAGLPKRLRWTLVFAAFFAFAGAVISARLRIGQPLIILGVIGLLLQGERLRWGTVTPLLALWTAWCGLGVFASEYPEAGSEGVLQLSKLAVITLVGANALRTRAQLRVFSAFALFAFLLYPGRGALLNYITGAFVIAGSRAVWNGVYSNPNDLAAIAILLLSIAAGLAVSERNRWPRMAAFATAAFLAFIIFITQSRGALIALGVFVVAVLWRAPKRQRVRAALATAAIGAVVIAFAPSSVWDRLSGLTNVSSDDMSQVDAEGSATQRFEIWKVAGTIIAEHPVTGVGIEAYPYEHARVALRPEFKFTARGNRDTHSTYLNVAAETGLIGFALFMSVIVVTVRRAERVRRRAASVDPGGAHQLLLLEFGMLAYLVAGLWGSYAKLNMLYLHLVLLWCTAKALETESVGGARPPTTGR
jgi:probable O-glycosylation ligase (exosortase A-associated)